MNSILGVQCHKVNKRFFLLTEKQYVIVLCETSWGCFKNRFKKRKIPGFIEVTSWISGHLKYFRMYRWRLSCQAGYIYLN